MSESGIQQEISDFGTKTRLRGFILPGILLAFSAYFSIQLARRAWTDATMPVLLRAITITVSALLVTIVASIGGSLIVRRIRTGRFLLTRAEVLAKRAKMRDHLGAGKPFWPQARIWLIGWVLLSIVTAFGIAALVAAARLKCKLPGTILLAALGFALLALPGLYVFKAIRRKRKTGSFLPSMEDLDKARAKCAQPKPIWLRILVAGTYWITALVWTIPALTRHTSHHRTFGSSWALPAMWWMMAAIWTWQIFHPRLPQCAIDHDILPSIKPPAS